MSSYLHDPMMGGGAPPDLGAALGGGPAPGGPAPAGPGGGIPGAPDSPDVTDLINQAADLLQKALDQEKDPEDKALIADLIAKAHKFAGSQQKLLDQAMGAGPGAKVIRKVSG